MFERLNNQNVVVLLAIGMIAASVIVLGGSYFIIQAFVIDGSEPHYQSVDWKPAPQRNNQMRPTLISE
jgi:hypothetical protein